MIPSSVRSYRFVFLFCLVLSMAARVGYAQSVVVEERTFQHRATLRGEVVAEVQEVLRNPINWPAVIDVMPDGALVEEGQVVMRFDPVPYERHLNRLRIDEKITTRGIAHQTARSRNSVQDLRDQLASLQDRAAYLEARMDRLESLPLEEEVRIAQGRLKVARLNEQAAEKDLQKARERFDKGFIAQAKLDEYKRTWREKQALLRYAQDELDYTELPATTLTLRLTELDLDNVRLEIENVQGSLNRTQRMLDLQRQRTDAQMKRLSQRIEEGLSDLENTELQAPRGGFAIQTQDFKDEVTGKGKFSKNSPLLVFPDLETLAIKAAIPETMRHRFNSGDPARVTLAPRPELSFDGEIASFGALPRDTGEKEKAAFQWGGTQVDTGIKVFDMMVRLTDPPEWLRPGMHARFEIESTRTLTAAAVPASYVRLRGEEAYLSVDGVYQPVEGERVGAWYHLKDRSWAGREVQLYGIFREATQSSGSPDGNPNPAGRGRFAAFGELVPLNTSEVFVNRIYGGWRNRPQVEWLAEEDSYVQKGDVVCRISTKNVDEEIQEQQTRLDEQTSEADAKREELELREAENEFQVKREKNLLEARAIDLALAERGRDWSGIFSAELDQAQARIELDGLSRELEWVRGKEMQVISPLEERRLERDVRRAQLKLERANIQLAQLRQGATELERSRARLDYLEQEYKLEQTRRMADFQLYEARRDLNRAEFDEGRARNRLKRLESMRSNYIIAAPADGFVRYSRIITEEGVQKVRVGSLVGEEFRIMRIADLSKLYTRVEVPEKYSHLVQAGLEVDVDLTAQGGSVLDGTVSTVEFLFEDKRRPETETGLYSSHEPLGETVFHVRVLLPETSGKTVKPGAQAQVFFPFGL